MATDGASGKRTTLKDVAEDAGVSIATVSDVLNRKQRTRTSDETRSRIRASAERLGYVPQRAGRSLRTGLSYHVGLLLSLARDRHLSPFGFQALDGAMRAAQETAWMITPIGCRDDEDRRNQIQRLKAERIVDGLVMVDPGMDDGREHALKSRLPLVMIGRSTDPDVYTVDNDNVQAACEATAHLLRAGHGRVSLIAAPLTSTLAVDRLQGYRRALAEADIPYEPALVIEADGFSRPAGEECMRRLLQQAPQRPRAVVAMDDNLALGAIQAAHQAGLRVPEDLAVVGFNDSSFAPYCEPPLTSVRIFAETLAYEAVSMLIRLINDQPVPTRRVIVPTQLIVRRSCGVAG